MAGDGVRPSLTDARVAAATLASLPAIHAGRLRALLDRWPDPLEALDAVRAGRAAEALRPNATILGWPDDQASAAGFAGGASSASHLAHLWSSAADPKRVRRQLEARRTRVLLDTDDDYPIADPLDNRPAVLMVEGDRPDALQHRRVAVVGTRAATPGGIEDAQEIGRFLASEGVTVISGMAIGIDRAAHEGVLGARGPGVPVGVLATGLDIVYPRRHGPLFERVRGRGLLVTEHGFGVQPAPWRFPLRNRIIAALAEVVVVVEATGSGGTRITADRAAEYGRAVMAVPGSRRNPAAAGSNRLIYDGASVLLDPADVITALGLGEAPRLGWHAASHRPPPPAGDAGAVLRSLAGEPATADQLATRCRLVPARVSVALSDLERAGWVRRERGFVWPM